MTSSDSQAEKRKAELSLCQASETKKEKMSRLARSAKNTDVNIDRPSQPDGNPDFEFFFGYKSPFSQHHACSFDIDGQTYNCAEQYFMHQKAVIFKDEEIGRKIMESIDPKEQKRLGRQVRNFDIEVWKKKCIGVVERATEAKFSQNPELKSKLFATCPKLLVEASPRDTVWGIGLGAGNPRAWDKSTWRGKNQLGYTMTRVRNRLMRSERKIDSMTDKSTWMGEKKGSDYNGGARGGNDDVRKKLNDEQGMKGKKRGGRKGKNDNSMNRVGKKKRNIDDSGKKLNYYGGMKVTDDVEMKSSDDYGKKGADDFRKKGGNDDGGRNEVKTYGLEKGSNIRKKKGNKEDGGKEDGNDDSMNTEMKHSCMIYKDNGDEMMDDTTDREKCSNDDIKEESIDVTIDEMKDGMRDEVVKEAYDDTEGGTQNDDVNMEESNDCNEEKDKGEILDDDVNRKNGDGIKEEIMDSGADDGLDEEKKRESSKMTY